MARFSKFLSLLLVTTAICGSELVRGAASNHVLLLSLDGMHAQDVARYVRDHPGSNLAFLLQHAVNYTRASAAEPADSFPGMLAIATGGSPATTGVYFDVTYDRSLYPPGVTAGPTGAAVVFDETVDFNSNLPDGGGGIDPSRLPLDPARGNAPVYPHNYLRVNTIFEVAKAAGLRTAWSDKHLTDEIVVGPSGNGVDDLFIPEIAALNEYGVTTTKSLELTEAYDDRKVQAIINEINGYDHAGANRVGTPAIFGMNFQAISVAQRLRTNKTPQGKSVVGALAGPGGYVDGSGAPSALLADAFNHTDVSLGQIRNALFAAGLLDSTYIVITAKHGQSPVDPTKLNFVPSSTVTGTVQTHATVAFASGDNALMIWLQDSSETSSAVSALLTNQVACGIQQVLANEILTLRYPSPASDPRTPDLIAVGNPGTIYSGSGGKIAEHGGYSEQDLNVPIIVCNPKLNATTIATSVQTRQLAPTMLQLLGLNPFALQAVVKERTTALPGFDPVFAAVSSPLTSGLVLTTNSVVHLGAGEMQFQLETARAQQFVVDVSTNLVDWSPIFTNTIVAAGSLPLQDSTASTADRFYRARTAN